MSDNPLDPTGDPFGPPEVSVEVECLHCGQQYQSHLIEWRIETSADGDLHGFWCCPTPDCSGKGFGFDILPTDPNYRDERGGWVHCDDDEFDEDDECGEDDYAEDEIGEDFPAGGLSDPTKPSGNGHGRPKVEEGRDDIPF